MQIYLHKNTHNLGVWRLSVVHVWLLWLSQPLGRWKPFNIIVTKDKNAISTFFHSFYFTECAKIQFYMQFFLGLCSGTDPSSARVMHSGQGDLLVQVFPLRRQVGALECRLTAQAKKSRGNNMEAVVPLLCHCPEHFRFSSSCDVDIPSRLMSCLEPSCNSCVFVLFSVICVLRENFQYLLLPVFLWPVAVWENVQLRIFLFQTPYLNAKMCSDNFCKCNTFVWD